MEFGNCEGTEQLQYVNIRNVRGGAEKAAGRDGEKARSRIKDGAVLPPDCLLHSERIYFYQVILTLTVSIIVGDVR